jgi:hypothetical protein
MTESLSRLALLKCVLLEESVQDVSRGDHTGLVRTKPPIAVPGNHRVAPITDGLGNERQDPQQCPPPGEVLSHPERGITAGETSGAFHQDKGVQGVWLQSMLRQERTADLRLEGRKREVAVRIALDDPLDRGRTEMTHTIEEDNCMVGLHNSGTPPSHTDTLAGRGIRLFDQSSRYVLLDTPSFVGSLVSTQLYTPYAQ